MTGRKTGGTIRAGEMAEWSIAAVLKTVGRKPRGFESLSLRQPDAPGSDRRLRGPVELPRGLPADDSRRTMPNRPAPPAVGAARG